MEDVAMSAIRLLAVVALVVGLAGPTALAGEVGPPPREVWVRAGKVPDLKLPPRPPVDAARTKKVKDLIAALAALDRPDYGLSATLRGDAFAPLPGQARAGAFLLTNHGVQTSNTLAALVAMGPDALPFLLDALDDPTPTKIALNHDVAFGTMYHAAELPINPVNPAEVAVYRARAAGAREEDKHVTEYTVKVGDVCFVAVGQIVGRSYSAVRYQPTACVVLNATTHDPKLCAEVRDLWRSNDPAGKLFESLLADYATEGVFNGRSLDGWGMGSYLQCGAALRLLYYFPKETAQLLAARLDKLNVGRDKNVDGYMTRCVANGVRAEDFVKALAWSKDPAVLAALVRMFKRAEDDEALLAALPAVDDKALIRSRLEPRLAALEADDDGPGGEGGYMLAALAERTPDTARPVFERYLKGAGSRRCHTACVVLRRAKVAWDVDVLAPLLEDTRTWGWTYAVVAGKNEPRLPIRVCDEAAVTLSRNHPEFEFVQAGEHADLDRQIATIREQLKARK
jgi:hypothetical protein